MCVCNDKSNLRIIANQHLNFYYFEIKLNGYKKLKTSQLAYIKNIESFYQSPKNLTKENCTIAWRQDCLLKESGKNQLSFPIHVTSSSVFPTLATVFKTTTTIKLFNSSFELLFGTSRKSEKKFKVPDQSKIPYPTNNGEQT